MKKILLAFILCSFMVMEGVVSAPVIVPASAPTSFWIKIIIKFGRPKYNCERGWGICVDWQIGWDPDGGTAGGGCPVMAKLENNTLSMQINESDLVAYEKGSKLPYFKDKQSVTFEDPYTFSEATCRALGSERPITIKPGTYPVTYSKGVYTITFPL